MVTTALGKLLWDRFSNVSPEFLNSTEGREKVAQATGLLLERSGEKEATRFESLCLVNSLLPPTALLSGTNGAVSNGTYGKLNGHARVEEYTRAVKSGVAQSDLKTDDTVKTEVSVTLPEEAVAFLAVTPEVSVETKAETAQEAAQEVQSEVSETRPRRRTATYGKGQRSIMFTNGRGAWRFRRSDWKRWLVAMSQQKKGSWIDPTQFGAVHLGPLVCDVSSWSREDYLKALSG